MLELLSSLTLPIIAGVTGFGVLVLQGEDITIDTIRVPYHMSWAGIDSDVVTRKLTDELRELNDTAASSLRQVEVDGSSLEKSVSEFSTFLNISDLVEGTRNLLGLVPYYINGELVGTYTDLTLTVRIYFDTDNDRSTHVVEVKGDKNSLDEMMRTAALDIIHEINPYVTVLYWRTRELACYESTEENAAEACRGLDPAQYRGAEFTFPKTLECADQFFQNRPNSEHFTVYGLLGRMYMLKAERDRTLDEEGRKKAYDQAVSYLEASLLQYPSFLFPNINLGMIYSSLGDDAQADAHFANAVRIDPNDLVTRQSWAATLTRQGRYREAAFQWVAAVEISPDDAVLRASLAGTYDQLGMEEAAEAQLKEAVLLQPTDPTYRQALAELTAD